MVLRLGASLADAADDPLNSSSEDAGTPPPRGRYCVRWLVALFSVLCGFTVGYDGSVAAVVLNKMVAEFALCGRHSIQETREASCPAKQAVMSMFTAGLLCGRLFLPWIADKFGRRPALVCADIMVIGAVGMQALANNSALFILGRFSLGLGLGFATVVESSYICEIAPPAQRGTLTVLNEVALCAGYLVGLQLTSILTLNHVSWRVAVALSAIPALVQLLMLPQLPESPRWLAVQGDSDGLEQSAKAIGLSEVEVNSLRKKVEQEAGKHCHGVTSLLKAQRSAWKSHSQAFFIALGFAAFSVLSSAFAMQAYARDVLRLLGVNDPSEWQPLVGFAKLAGAVLAMSGADSPCVGRRRLATVGALGCCLCQMLIAVRLSMYQTLPVAAGVVAFLTSILTWNAGYGGLALTIPFEIVPNDVRSVWVGQIFATTGIIDVLLTQNYLSLLQANAAATFFFFAAVNLAAATFAAFVLPEAGKQSLEETSSQQNDQVVSSQLEEVSLQHDDQSVSSQECCGNVRVVDEAFEEFRVVIAKSSQASPYWLQHKVGEQFQAW